MIHINEVVKMLQKVCFKYFAYTAKYLRFTDTYNVVHEKFVQIIDF